MISKSLIISTNLGKDITSLEESKSVNYLLMEIVRTHLQELCEAYNIDADHVHVNHLPVSMQLDHIENYMVPLEEDCVIEPIVKATKQYVHSTILANRASSGLSVELMLYTVVNFNIVFLANGTIILTEEVFKL